MHESRTAGQTKQRFLVVDDHEMVLAVIVLALREKYPDVEVVTARDRQSAQQQVQLYRPSLIMLDLSMPDKPNSPASPEVGIQFLRTLMKSSPASNIMVLSTNVKSLVRLKPAINNYEAGFAAMDKSLSVKEMLKLLDMTLRGSIYLPTQVRSRPEFERKWQELLNLKFQQGLSDKAIATCMSVSDRTVRNYWVRIQDALGIYYEPDKDLQVQIELEARKIGLLD